MFSGKQHAGLFSTKKDEKKPPATNPTGLFSGLGIKGKAPAKEASPDYTPPSIPVLPPKSDVYVPPVLPSQRQPLPSTEASTGAFSLKDSPTVEPVKPAELEALDSLRPKGGFLAGMRAKNPGQPEEAKVFSSKKNDFTVDIKPETRPKLEGSSGHLTDLRNRTDDPFSASTRDEESFAPSRAAIEGKKLLEKSRKEKEEKEEKDRIERERRAAEEKDRQRYQNPDQLIAWVEERLTSYAKQLDEKNKKQMELLTEAAKLQEKMTNLEMRKNQTMEKQELAAADEDYEQAERLNQTIKDMELIILQTSSDLAKNASLYQSYESDKTEIYTSQRKFLSEVQLKASEKKSTEEADLSKFKSELLQLKASKEKKFSDESQRLSDENARLAAETEVLESEKTETEGRISQHTHELQVEKETAESELASIEIEIEELERTLALKKMQKQQLVETITSSEEQIKERLAAFQDEIMEVELKVNRLEQGKLKTQKEMENLEAAKADFAVQCENSEKEAENWNLRNGRLQVCLEDLKSRQERLEKLVGVRETYLARIEENTKILKVKQEELMEAEEYARTVKEADEEIRHKFVQRRERLSELEVKIPKLEAEKKTFAAAKQYKDAARLANEAKTAITERESLLDEIEKLQLRMNEQDQQSAEVGVM